MVDITPGINSVHAEYVKLTRLSVPLNLGRLLRWEIWLLKFTEADLRLVVAHLHKLYEGKVFLTAMLGFNNLIEKTDRFQELLAEAKLSRRSRPPATDRDSVLRVTGRTSELTKPPRSAAEIIRDEEAFRAFRALKDML